MRSVVFNIPWMLDQQIFERWYFHIDRIGGGETWWRCHEPWFIHWVWDWRWGQWIECSTIMRSNIWVVSTVSSCATHSRAILYFNEWNFFFRVSLLRSAVTICKGTHTLANWSLIRCSVWSWLWVLISNAYLLFRLIAIHRLHHPHSLLQQTWIYWLFRQLQHH